MEDTKKGQRGQGFEELARAGSRRSTAGQGRSSLWPPAQLTDCVADRAAHAQVGLGKGGLLAHQVAQHLLQRAGGGEKHAAGSARAPASQ